MPKPKPRRLVKDDDLLTCLAEIAEFRGTTPRVLREIIATTDFPIWYENNVPKSRKSLIRAYDAEKARANQQRIRANMAAGAKWPGRLKTSAPTPSSAE